MKQRVELAAAVEWVVDQFDRGNGGIPSNDSATIKSWSPVSGGCIADANIVSLTDGREFFLKCVAGTTEMFECEAKGLAAIAKANFIRTPTVIGTGTTETGTGFLVLQAVKRGRPDSDFMEQLGRALAMLHRGSVAPRFGFRHDNFIGSTRQINSWKTSWLDFFAQHRILFQLSLARNKAKVSPSFCYQVEKLISRLGHFLGDPSEPPVLIHGDLWSGNVMSDAAGKPVLIDPAVYFGSREAEFGMTTLFGGFNDHFYAAYNECWPMSAGWETRVEIYQLYHLMNHLNLFGTGYLSRCESILKKYS